MQYIIFVIKVYKKLNNKSGKSTYTKYRIMKNRILMIGAMFLFVVSMATAQICPPTNSSRIYNTGFNNIGNSFYNSYGNGSMLNSLSYSFANIVNQGYNNGKLTKNEIWKLENDFNRLNREIRWAYADGRVSFSEKSMIDMYMRRLERNISREWNDLDTRLG